MPGPLPLLGDKEPWYKSSSEWISQARLGTLSSGLKLATTKAITPFRRYNDSLHPKSLWLPKKVSSEILVKLPAKSWIRKKTKLEATKTTKNEEFPVCVQSEEDLRALLLRHGINTKPYGAGKCKSMSQLFEEIACRESVLVLRPKHAMLPGNQAANSKQEGEEEEQQQREEELVRLVNVVEVRIEYAGRVLVEAYQEFADGRRRQRNMLLAEKMIGGEQCTAAATRAIAEELEMKLPVDALEDIEAFELQEMPKQLSPSYPGLASVYTLHKLRVDLTHVSLGIAKYRMGLPYFTDFVTSEYAHAGPGGGRGALRLKHGWSWCDAAEWTPGMRKGLSAELGEQAGKQAGDKCTAFECPRELDSDGTAHATDTDTTLEQSSSQSSEESECEESEDAGEEGGEGRAQTDRQEDNSNGCVEVASSATKVLVEGGGDTQSEEKDDTGGQVTRYCKAASVAELTRLLTSHNVSVDEFGRKQSKPLDALVEEINTGACVLEFDHEKLQVVRKVRIAVIKVVKEGRALVLTYERLADQRMRRLFRFPSIKCRSSDGYEQYALSELGKRLKIPPQLLSEYWMKQKPIVAPRHANLGELRRIDVVCSEVTDSVSFPSLPTVYEQHTLKVSLSRAGCFPSGDSFMTAMTLDEDGISLRSYWEWYPEAMARSIVSQQQAQQAKQQTRNKVDRRKSEEGVDGAEEGVDEGADEGVEDYSGATEGCDYDGSDDECTDICPDEDEDNGFEVGSAKYRLLQQLCAGCSSARYRHLHGGLSGASVVKLVKFKQGQQQMPTVVKIDSAANIQEELLATKRVTKLIGDSAPKVIGIPVTAADAVVAKDLVATTAALIVGALELELAGACWILPELADADTALVNTFKDLFVWELASAVSTSYVGAIETEKQVYGEVLPVLNEVFGRVLPSCTLKTASRAHIFGTSEDGAGSHNDLFSLYGTSDAIQKHMLSARDGHAGEHSLFQFEQLSDGAAATFEQLVQRVSDREWSSLQSWGPLTGVVHGDLNGSNVLIDAQSEVWLIDFAKSKQAHVLVDFAKFESSILFEYTSLPMSAADFKVAKSSSELGSWLGISSKEASCLFEKVSEGTNVSTQRHSHQVVTASTATACLQQACSFVDALSTNSQGDLRRQLQMDFAEILPTDRCFLQPRAATDVNKSGSSDGACSEDLQAALGGVRAALSVGHSAIKKLRAHLLPFVSLELNDSRSLPVDRHSVALQVALLSYALRIVSYAGIAPQQKRWALHAATGYASSVTRVLDTGFGSEVMEVIRGGGVGDAQSVCFRRNQRLFIRSNHPVDGGGRREQAQNGGWDVVKVKSYDEPTGQHLVSRFDSRGPHSLELQVALIQWFDPLGETNDDGFQCMLRGRALDFRTFSGVGGHGHESANAVWCRRYNTLVLTVEHGGLGYVEGECPSVSMIEPEATGACQEPSSGVEGGTEKAVGVAVVGGAEGAECIVSLRLTRSILLRLEHQSSSYKWYGYQQLVAALRVSPPSQCERKLRGKASASARKASMRLLCASPSYASLDDKGKAVARTIINEVAEGTHFDGSQCARTVYDQLVALCRERLGGRVACAAGNADGSVNGGTKSWAAMVAQEWFCPMNTSNATLAFVPLLRDIGVCAAIRAELTGLEFQRWALHSSTRARHQINEGADDDTHDDTHDDDDDDDDDDDNDDDDDDRRAERVHLRLVGTTVDARQHSYKLADPMKYSGSEVILKYRYSADTLAGKGGVPVALVQRVRQEMRFEASGQPVSSRAVLQTTHFANCNDDEHGWICSAAAAVGIVSDPGLGYGSENNAETLAQAAAQVLVAGVKVGTAIIAFPPKPEAIDTGNGRQARQEVGVGFTGSVISLCFDADFCWPMGLTVDLHISPPPTGDQSAFAAAKAIALQRLAYAQGLDEGQKMGMHTLLDRLVSAILAGNTGDDDSDNSNSDTLCKISSLSAAEVVQQLPGWVFDTVGSRADGSNWKEEDAFDFWVGQRVNVDATAADAAFEAGGELDAMAVGSRVQRKVESSRLFQRTVEGVVAQIHLGGRYSVRLGGDPHAGRCGGGRRNEGTPVSTWGDGARHLFALSALYIRAVDGSTDGMVESGVYKWRETNEEADNDNNGGEEDEDDEDDKFCNDDDHLGVFGQEGDRPTAPASDSGDVRYRVCAILLPILELSGLRASARIQHVGADEKLEYAPGQRIQVAHTLGAANAAIVGTDAAAGVKAAVQPWGEAVIMRAVGASTAGTPQSSSGGGNSSNRFEVRFLGSCGPELTIMNLEPGSHSILPSARYENGQCLTVYIVPECDSDQPGVGMANGGCWKDVTVTGYDESTDSHTVTEDETSRETTAQSIESSQFPPTGRHRYSLVLSGVNHAVRHLTAADASSEWRRYCSYIRTRHSFIVDALSGQRLDILRQCVNIAMSTTASSTSNPTSTQHITGSTADDGTEGLLEEEEFEMRLFARSTFRQQGRLNELRVLVLAPAASGKTCLLNRILTLSLINHQQNQQQNHSGATSAAASGVSDHEFVPVLILVVDLARKWQQHNWSAVYDAGDADILDLYLRATYGENTMRYKMLRQCALARRLLILLDGIDEGSTLRSRIENFATIDLVKAGHRLVVTSRPSGLTKALYSDFEHVHLLPLSTEQQLVIAKNRLGSEELAVKFEAELQSPDYQQIASNPLMLSMMLSVFMSSNVANQASFPKKRTDLYDIAVKTMLTQVDKKQKHTLATTTKVHTPAAPGMSSSTDLVASSGMASAAASMVDVTAVGSQQPQEQALPLLEFLQAIAWTCHKAKTKNITSSVLVEANFTSAMIDAWNFVQAQVKSGKMPLLVCISEGVGADDEEDSVLRFAHLTFQEFLAAKHVMGGGEVRLRRLTGHGRVAHRHDAIDGVQEEQNILGPSYFKAKMNLGWWAQVINMCASISADFADGVLAGDNTGKQRSTTREGTPAMVKLRKLNAIGTQTVCSLLKHASAITGLDLSTVHLGPAVGATGAVAGAGVHDLCAALRGPLANTLRVLRACDSGLTVADAHVLKEVVEAQGCGLITIDLRNNDLRREGVMLLVRAALRGLDGTCIAEHTRDDDHCDGNGCACRWCRHLSRLLLENNSVTGPNLRLTMPINFLSKANAPALARRVIDAAEEQSGCVASLVVGLLPGSTDARAPLCRARQASSGKAHRVPVRAHQYQYFKQQQKQQQQEYKSWPSNHYLTAVCVAKMRSIGPGGALETVAVRLSLSGLQCDQWLGTGGAQRLQHAEQQRQKEEHSGELTKVSTAAQSWWELDWVKKPPTLRDLSMSSLPQCVLMLYTRLIQHTAILGLVVWVMRTVDHCHRRCLLLRLHSSSRAVPRSLRPSAHHFACQNERSVGVIRGLCTASAADIALGFWSSSVTNHGIRSKTSSTACVRMERQRKVLSSIKHRRKKDSRAWSPPQHSNYRVSCMASNWPVEDLSAPTNTGSLITLCSFSRLTHNGRVNGTMSLRFAATESDGMDADASFMHVHGLIGKQARKKAVKRRQQVADKHLRGEYDIGHAECDDGNERLCCLKTVASGTMERLVCSLETHLAMLRSERKQLQLHLPKPTKWHTTQQTPETLVRVNFDRNTGCMQDCLSNDVEEDVEVTLQNKRTAHEVGLSGQSLPKKSVLLRKLLSQIDLMSDRLLMMWRKLLFVWLQLPRMKGRVQLEWSHFNRLVVYAENLLKENSAMAETEVPELHNRLDIKRSNPPEVRISSARISRRSQKKERREAACRAGKERRNKGHKGWGTRCTSGSTECGQQPALRPRQDQATGRR
jgi:hypothetical protein